MIIFFWGINSWNSGSSNSRVTQPAEAAIEAKPNPYDYLKEMVVDKTQYGYVYKDGNYFGFLDQDLNVVTKAQYDKVEPFVNNWAIVHRNNKRGYVDAKGQEVIKPQFDRAWNFSVDYKGLAKVQVGRKTAYINTKGIRTEPPKTNSGGGY